MNVHFCLRLVDMHHEDQLVEVASAQARARANQTSRAAIERAGIPARYPPLTRLTNAARAPDRCARAGRSLPTCASRRSPRQPPCSPPHPRQ